MNRFEPKSKTKSNNLPYILFAYLDWPFCDYSAKMPHCAGLRCPLGNCLQKNQICNGQVECHDGSDENQHNCQQRSSCAADEMKCGNGQCISKTKFCDGFNDCGDLTDEPIHCTCHAYLKYFFGFRTFFEINSVGKKTLTVLNDF